MENIKQCSNCTITYTPYGQRNSLCKECRREYDRNYHKKRSKESKAHKQNLQKEKILRNRQFVFDFYKKNPCSICGETRIATLQCDHLDRDLKSENIAILTQTGCSLDTLKLELNKCRVLCANCHAVHTAEQFGWYGDLQ